MSEHLEQVRLVAWFRKTYKEDEHIIFAIPNGGKGRTITEGAKLKAEGVLSGVFDLCVPSLNLWIEMKDKGGKLSKNQKKFLDFINKKTDQRAAVCFSFEEAKMLIMGAMKVYYANQPTI